MRLRFLIFPAIFYLILTPEQALSAEKEIELEPIVITQDEFQQEADIPTKNITTIDMRRKPFAPVEEILDYQGGVDVSRRSILGIQSDLSIRGSTPDQTQVSINGIIINDPQTAHHNLDLGLPSGSVEKIEVTRAQAPTIWAQGAMGGAVNFVTKRPTKDEAEVSFLYGTDETHKSSLSITRNKGGLGFGLQAEEASSNGWRYDTDFKELALASSGLVKLSDIISSNLLIAYGEKEFGACYFYGPYHSKEWTDTLFLNWDFCVGQERFQIIPKLYFRRHHDKYMLDIKRPDYYLNHHKTDIEGAMLQAEADLEGYGRITAFADINREDIKSTRLGKHSRHKNSFFLSWRNYRGMFPLPFMGEGQGEGSLSPPWGASEAKSPAGKDQGEGESFQAGSTRAKFGYDLSLRIDDYSEYDTEILPQAGIFFMLSPDIKFRSSVARAVRAPTYTELYYDSPANKGNKDLSPEEALNYEVGLDITYFPLPIGERVRARGKEVNISLSCTIFRRDSSDLIDWIKQTPSQAYYQAKNITELKTEGIETELSLKPVEWLCLRAGYVYLDSDIDEDIDYISKYALNHPDHKVTGEAEVILPFGTQNLKFLYKDRKNYTHYFIMGLGLNYKFVKESILFLNIDNIFNSTNEDIKDNPLPGRQIQVGVKVRF